MMRNLWQNRGWLNNSKYFSYAPFFALGHMPHMHTHTHTHTHIRMSTFRTFTRASCAILSAWALSLFCHKGETMSSDDVLLSYQQHALWRHNPTVLLQPVLPRQTDINNGFVRNYLLKHTHTHTKRRRRWAQYCLGKVWKKELGWFYSF